MLFLRFCYVGNRYEINKHLARSACHAWQVCVQRNRRFRFTHFLSSLAFFTTHVCRRLRVCVFAPLCAQILLPCPKRFSTRIGSQPLRPNPFSPCPEQVSPRLVPFPREYFRQILPVLSDVVLVFDQKIVHFLIQMSAAVSKLRQMLERLLDEAEAVDMVLHAHIEGRCDRAPLPDSHVRRNSVRCVCHASARESASDSRGTQKTTGLSLVNSESNSASVRPCGCSMFDCSFIKSTTLTKRIFSSGM